eukprot:TRINITY_DN10494_c0_g1_i2.p1 TRINITY_DN10494_c0_g1~~TRINITY_DN10494_c0_g1_i2.p1  ORF type:complete len:418 (+),score=72.10 TRINITY_DN10494_c0_g1_i2:281-1534(+)
MFDRVVAEQIFERMEKNPDGTSNIEEFIKVFLEADDILIHKIENADRFLRDYHRQRAEASSKLNDLRQTERLNSYGIMDGSNLTVQIQESHNLEGADFSPNPRYYVVAILEQQRHQTEVAPGASPAWNETLSFEVKTGLDDLKVSVISKDAQREETAGQIVIPISRLRDQQKIEEWFDLLDRNGAKTRGRIRLTLQWIHSRVKYLSDIIRKWDEHIKFQNEDKADYQRDLDALHEPFPSLRGGAYAPPSGPIAVSGLPNDERNAEAVSSRRPVYRSSDDQGQQQQQPDSKFLKWTVIAEYVHLALAILVCFDRAAFTDIIVPSYFLVQNFLKRLSVPKLTILLAMTGVAILFDIVWLGLYSKHWWSGFGDPEHGVQQGLKAFIVFLTWILLIGKFGLLVLFYLVGRNWYSAPGSAVV